MIHAPKSTRSTVTVTATAVMTSVPNSDNCVVQYFGQCDGDAYNGCNNCADGLTCVFYTSK
jgi:Fungal cellulose binding domain